MDLTTAQRMQKLRKANGYSQEVLAEKLGISRQSVSKWERGEASPETDNLIALAKIYGISVDELIDTEKSEPKAKMGGSQRDVMDKIKSLLSKANDFGIYPVTAKKLSVFPFPIVITVIYVALSLALKIWHPLWILFITLPIYYRFAIACKANSTKAFALLQPVPEITVLIYLLLGVFGRLWGYGAILFLAIPVYYWAVMVSKKGDFDPQKKVEPKRQNGLTILIAVLVSILVVITCAVSVTLKVPSKKTNRMPSFSVSDQASTPVSAQQAKNIALEDASLADNSKTVIVEQSFDVENGNVYSITFTDDKLFYDYKINLDNGKIISKSYKLCEID